MDSLSALVAQIAALLYVSAGLLKASPTGSDARCSVQAPAEPPAAPWRFSGSIKSHTCVGQPQQQQQQQQEGQWPSQEQQLARKGSLCPSEVTIQWWAYMYSHSLSRHCTHAQDPCPPCLHDLSKRSLWVPAPCWHSDSRQLPCQGPQTPLQTCSLLADRRRHVTAAGQLPYFFSTASADSSFCCQLPLPSAAH